ncbi:S-layer homology domain-containing protein, partial [Paenibacillus sp. CN-4]|uniref:S-layer homology domain-containing protein n=1 Tax=Paenibacillus nanchangensis TaxID=3348343 RepID=UPI00397BF3B4
DGGAVVTDVVSSDGGRTYQVKAALEEGQTYAVTLTKETYVFTINPVIVPKAEPTQVSGEISNVTANGFTVTFTPAVDGLNAENFTIGGAVVDQVNTLDGGKTYQISSQLQPGGIYSLILDKKGYLFNALLIMVPIIPPVDPTPVTGTISGVGTSGFTLALSPAVEGLTAADISLSGGAAVTNATTTDGGLTYRVAAQLEEGQTYSVNVVKKGYTFTVSDVTVPKTPPVDPTPVTGSVSEASPSGFTLALSPAVEGLTAADISLSGGAAVSNATTTDGGLTYQVTAQLEEGQTYSVNVVKNGYTFTVSDVTVPKAPPVDPTPVTGSVSEASPSGFTLTFSPAVEGLTAADISLSGGAAVTNVTTTDGGLTYQVTAQLEEGQTYNVNVVKNGYTFTVSDVTVPKAPPVDPEQPQQPEQPEQPQQPVRVEILSPASSAVVTVNVPVITGRTLPGTPVTIYVDGRPIGSVITSADGTWSLTPSVPLAEGEHELKIWAGPAAGSGQTAEVSAKFVVDTVAPAAPVITKPGDGTGSGTGNLSLEGTAEAGSSVTVYVNGQAAGTAFADMQGKWSLQLSVQSLGDYVITATASDTANHVSEASAPIRWSRYEEQTDTGPAPAAPNVSVPTQTPGVSTIEVKVVSGSQGQAVSSTTIERTNTNGSVKDKVTFTESKAAESVEKAKAAGRSDIRIVIPDEKDEVSELNVQLPSGTLRSIIGGQMDFEIYTDNVQITVPSSSLTGLANDVYFRVIPVKNGQDRAAIRQRALQEKIVQSISGTEQPVIVARPMEIETNLTSRPVTLTLPLKGVEFPSDPAQRQAFLDSLAIYIEHSDGDIELVRGQIVTYEGGTQGIRFGVNKFSTFTILSWAGKDLGELLEKLGKGSQNGGQEDAGSADVHTAYINGFPDRTFRPESGLTRAQMAAILARLMGYTGAQESSATVYPDVAKTHWAAGAIAVMKEKGLMIGDRSGAFHADQAITRAELAAVAARISNLETAADRMPAFGDTAGHWAADAIAASWKAGWIKGYADGTFRPNKAVSRAEAVVLLNRVFRRGPLQGMSSSSWKDVPLTHWASADIEEASKTHSFTRSEGGEEQLSAILK